MNAGRVRSRTLLQFTRKRDDEFCLRIRGRQEETLHHDPVPFFPSCPSHPPAGKPHGATWSELAFEDNSEVGESMAFSRIRSDARFV